MLYLMVEARDFCVYLWCKVEEGGPAAFWLQV